MGAFCCNTVFILFEDNDFGSRTPFVFVDAVFIIKINK